MVTTDSTIVDHNIPGPESHGVPLCRLSISLRKDEATIPHLFHLKSLLALGFAVAIRGSTSLLLSDRCGCGCISHIYVGHDMYRAFLKILRI